MDTQVSDTSAWGEPESSVGGKNDGALDELPAPSLRPVYWLTGQSRLLVEDLVDGDQKEVVTHVSALVWVDQQGRDLNLQIHPCDIALPQVDGKDLKFDSDAVQSLDSGPIRGGLLPPDSEDDQGWRLWTDEAVMTLGVELDDPFDEPLPVDDDDPALVDVDEDGKPGVSIRLGLFKIYAAFRFRLALSAEMTEEDGFLGETSLVVDQQLYGDNIPFFDAVKAANEAMEDLRVIDEIHSFSMIAVAPDQASCSGLMESEEHVSSSD